MQWGDGENCWGGGETAEGVGIPLVEKGGGGDRFNESPFNHNNPINITKEALTK